MPLPLSTQAIAEKNKLVTDAVFLEALKITIPGVSDPVRLVNDSKNVSWLYENSLDAPWVAFPFTINEITEASGEVPRVDIQISNVDREMDQYLEFYDAYIKANGYSPIVVNIYVINTARIAAVPNAAPEVEHIFELKQPKLNAQWATFTLGANNPDNRRFPQNRILKNHCRFRFEGADGHCGHTGGGSCNHTLAACRALDNSERFGGASGVGASGFEIT